MFFPLILKNWKCPRFKHAEGDNEGWRRKRKGRRKGHRTAGGKAGHPPGSVRPGQHLEQGKDAPRASASVYSPSGGKPRAGLVSRLLSRLVSRLHPWLMLGRGIRLLRASVQHEGFQRRWTSLMKTEKLTKCQSHSINVITTLPWWLSTCPCCVSWRPCQQQEVWTKT